MAAGVFQTLVDDLRAVMCIANGRSEKPKAAIFDSRTLQSTPESRARAGYDGAKRSKGRKAPIAVDTLGHLLALHVTATSGQDRSQVEELAHQVQEAAGDHVEIAYADQGYTRERAAEAAQEPNIQLEVFKLSGTKRGLLLLPRRWVVERVFAWMARFRQLARDYERFPETIAGLHLLAVVMILMRRFF